MVMRKKGLEVWTWCRACRIEEKFYVKNWDSRDQVFCPNCDREMQIDIGSYESNKDYYSNKEIWFQPSQSYDGWHESVTEPLPPPKPRQKPKPPPPPSWGLTGVAARRVRME